MALAGVDRLLADAMIGRTPVHEVRVSTGGNAHRILLKLEAFNGCGGSIKSRTVRGLLDRAAAGGVLSPGMTVIESTSGNLGAALAIQGGMRGLRVIVVADPKTTAANLEKIGVAGASVEMVKTPDANDSFLEARLERVHDLLQEIPESLWLNQYQSEANPEIHFFTTGPEIVESAPDADAIFIACSTGGTVAGVAARVRAAGIKAEVVPVDVPGSHTIRDGIGPRILTGIGASRPSCFIREEERACAEIVDDLEAISACRLLDSSTGISVGGSSGAAFVGALQWLQGRPGNQTVLVLCADGGENYDFTNEGLARQGIHRLPSLNHLIDDLAMATYPTYLRPGVAFNTSIHS